MYRHSSFAGSTALLSMSFPRKDPHAFCRDIRSLDYLVYMVSWNRILFWSITTISSSFHNALLFCCPVRKRLLPRFQNKIKSSCKCGDRPWGSENLVVDRERQVFLGNQALFLFLSSLDRVSCELAICTTLRRSSSSDSLQYFSVALAGLPARVPVIWLKGEVEVIFAAMKNQTERYMCSNDW